VPISLSKLTALEAALEYLIKATPGESLEYLNPGEKPPGETPVRTTQRGARGYYPSEVAGGEEEAAAPREAEPTEEREIEAVQAPEAKTKALSEYPKRIFDHATEQYLRVIVPDNPDVHGVEPGIHSLKQPQGAPVRGKPISIYDSKIPETVYHMTTNAPAVRASKKLIAGGVGGLGGDTNDQIISLTINKEIAYQLAEDTKLASEISRMGGGEHRTPERTEASKAILKRLNQEMEKEGWHSEIFSRYSDDHYEYMHEGYNAKEWLAQYFTFRARETANLGKEKLNPLFFTDPEDLAKINPENVDVIEIPKSALRTGAMITDFDLDNRYGLQEIRIYGDIGVSEAVQAPEAKPELSPPFGSTLVEGYVRDTETGRMRVVPRTPSGEAPTRLYRVMDKGEYDDAVGQGELKPALKGDGRIFAAGEPSLQYAEPKPTVLLAIEYSDDDGWAARSGAAGEVTAATYDSIPISKITVLAEGANGGELRDNYNLITDNLSKLLLDTVTSADDSIRIGNLNIPIEVATDPASGLSGRDRLAPNTGMLFIFDKSPVITMKGMKFPLDIVWMADNKVVDLTENALVPVLESASLYTPKKHATTALEINGGEVQTLGIKIGDSVDKVGNTHSNLSKLLVLETALEYFIKAEAGERLEYLSPGEKAPGDTRIHTTARGARGYYPSEVVGGEKETEEPSELEPEEEREIQVVSPESLSEEDQQPLSEEDQRRQDYHEMEGTLQKFNEEGKGYVKRLLAGTQFEYLKESERSLQTAEDVINWATDGIMQPMDYFEQLMELMDVIPIQDLEPFYDALSEMAAEAEEVVKLRPDKDVGTLEEQLKEHKQHKIDISNTPSAIINAEYNLKRQYAYFVENLLPRLQALPKGNDNPLIRKILVDAVEGTQLHQDLPDSLVSALIQMAPSSLLREWYDFHEGKRLSTSTIEPQESMFHVMEKPSNLLQNHTVQMIALQRLKRLTYFPDGASTQFQEKASRIDDLKEDERLLPPLEDWPKKFQNLMKNIWRKENPTTLMVKLIDELYKSTPYGLFHFESKSEWEEGSSEPLAGVLKESASRILDGPIVFHNEMVGDEYSAEMIHAGIESVYEVYQNHFPSKEFVDQYLKVQKQVTYELLDMAFPDIDDFELFRGLGHRGVSKELENLARDQAEWDQASREEEAADEDEEEEEDEFFDPDAPVPDFDKLFSNVSGLFDENPLTSWSLDYHAASANFARDRGDDGVVLRRRVSKKDIWSSFMTHAYDGNELEMIVIPHKDDFTLGARYRDGEHSIGLERGEDTYSADERVSNRGLVISNRFSPRSLEGSEYREHLRIIEAEKKDLEGIDKAEKDEQESKKPIIIDDAENADWIKEVRKKLEEKKTNNLSKLLVLETALEYLAKVESGKREYLAPGEKAPEGLKEYPGSRPGVRYYVPGESKSKQEFPSMHTISSPELPVEEREVEAVSPGDWDSFERRLRVREEEETARQKSGTSFEDESRKQFEAMATDLEEVLSSINPEHKQFLGTPFDDSKLIGDNLEYVAFTDGSFEGSITPSGAGIHSEFNWTTFIDGKPFIYKVVSGENRAEHLSYSIDRALGLNVVPYIKPYNMDIDTLHKAFQKSQKEPIVNRIISTVVGQSGRPPHLFSAYIMGELEDRFAGQGWENPAAAGHFMEFCENCLGGEEAAEGVADMLTTKEGREEFFKLMLLDFISGNDDRHSGNWLVTKDKKVLAIDNGYAGNGRLGPLDQTLDIDVGKVSYSMKLGFGWRVQDALTAHLMDLDLDDNEIQEYMTRLQNPETLGDEADNIFDKYYDLEKIQKAIDPINWAAESFWDNDDEAREAFKKYAVPFMRRGMVGDFEGNTPTQLGRDRWASARARVESSNRLDQEQINAIRERLDVSPPEAEGFLSRIRNWIRLGGPEPESAPPSSPEFQPEFEGDTPPSQRGGPQQGRRGRS